MLSLSEKDIIYNSLGLNALEGLNAFINMNNVNVPNSLREKIIHTYIKEMAKSKELENNVDDEEEDNIWIITNNLDIVKFINNYIPSSTSNKYWKSIIALIQSDNDVHKACGWTVDTYINIIEGISLEEGQDAKYVDEFGYQLKNFLPFDQYRLNSFIVENIAPYNAQAIGVFNGDDIVYYIVLNKLLQKFDTRLYRVGIMSDIHYNDGQIDIYDNVGSHVDGSGEYVADIKNALSFMEKKDAVDFICAAGDITTNDMQHLVNFRSLLQQTCPTTPFYSCFGNHDYCATSLYTEIDDEVYEELCVKGKTKLDIWNTLAKPTNSLYKIHCQDDSNGYGQSSFWFEVPVNNNKSDIYVFLSVNYLDEKNRNYDDTPKYDKMKADKLQVDATKSGGPCEALDQDDEYSIVVKYDASSQRMLYDYHYIGGNSYKCQVLNSKVVDADGNDVTNLLDSDNPLIGIYGADGKYHISGEFNCNKIYVYDKYWFEIPISSKFETTYPDIKLPVTLYMDAQVYGITINTSESANYSLQDDDPYMEEIKQYLLDNNIDIPPSYNLKFYDNASLIWLKDLLETYKDKRIFIFTHLQFPHKAGNNVGPGYSYSMDLWRIQPNDAYCLCGIQFEFLNLLNDIFKNVIWFTGHSHYNYDTQITDSTVIICNKEYDIFRPGKEYFSESMRYFREKITNLTNIDMKNDASSDVLCGYNIHIPSTSRPLASNFSNNRKLSYFYYQALQLDDSEGMIMDIYEDYVDIRGITFKDNLSYKGEYVNKYHPTAQYRIPIPAK